MEMLFVNPSFWVACGFFTVIAIIVFKGSNAVLGSSYERIRKITDNIVSAEQVREQAQKLLVEQEKKYREIVEESKVFIEQARQEALVITEEIQEKTQNSIKRARIRSRENINRAESEAIDEIRKVVLEKATEVVKIITEKFKALLKNKHRISEKLITEILTVNGIRFTLDDGSWGLIRASSNKPSLVIVTESVQSKMDMKAIFNFIDKLLKETGKVGSYDQKI